MSVSVGNKVNLSTQVSHRMKQDIRRGLYKHGQYLPSMRRLSQQYGVSFNVIYRAIRELEYEGIVVTHHGKGVWVREESPAEQSSILFGFIYPYPIEMPFERQILQAIEEAFGSKNNLVVVRSSKLSEENERMIAKHFVNNGVRGLILFPVPADKNGEFFAELAKSIPVILVDRLLKPHHHNIPAVIFDTFNLGRDICIEFFCVRKKKKLLVIVDDLDISPYKFLIDGVEEEARELNRENDLKIIRLPISDMLLAYYKGDLAPMNQQLQKMKRLFKNVRFDAVYCTQDEYIAHILIESGLWKTLPDVIFGTQINPLGATINLPRYIKVPVITWMMDFPALFARAAELVQEALLAGKKLEGVIQMEVPQAKRRVVKMNYPAWMSIPVKEPASYAL